MCLIQTTLFIRSLHPIPSIHIYLTFFQIQITKSQNCPKIQQFELNFSLFFPQSQSQKRQNLSSWFCWNFTNQDSNLANPMKPKLGMLVLMLLLVSVFTSIAESKCSKGCDLALASYYVWSGSNLTFIAQVLQSNLNIIPKTIVSYNKQTITNQDNVSAGVRVNVPFPCGCINGEFLGHVFEYTVHSGDTYLKVAQGWYANLTTYQLLENYNSYDPNRIPDTNAKLNVTVTCSCGDSSVTKDYGLFITYPLQPGDTLESIALATNFNATLLQSYNQGVNFSQGSGVVYIPGKGT